MNAIQSIRRAGSNDIALLASLIQRSFEDVALRFGLTRENCPKHPSNCTPEWVKADMERGVTFFLFLEGNTPVGAVAIEQPRSDPCYSERLSVLPEWRKKGIGDALDQHIIADAQKRGAREISIAIIAEQDDLRGWYEKRGFTMESRKRFEHLPFEVMFMRYRWEENRTESELEYSTDR